MRRAEMSIFQATGSDLRDSFQNVRAQYSSMKRPRRWYTALIIAVLVRNHDLREWDSWAFEPPQGAPVRITGAAVNAAEMIFGTMPGSVLKNNPGGVRALLGEDEGRLIIDPFRQSPGSGTDGICVVARRHDRVVVPFEDPSWIWNQEAQGNWTDSPDTHVKEFKSSNDYKTQQGVACGWPATELYDMGPAAASTTFAAPRSECPHRHFDTSREWPDAPRPLRAL